MAVEHLTEQTFDSAVASGVCAVDFWAPWCGPCRMQGPIFESVALELEGSGAKFFKVNVDEAPELAAKFGIMSMPAIFCFRDGAKVAEFVGVTDVAEIRSCFA